MTVEYGADLHSSEKGSGFPTAVTAVETETDVQVNDGRPLKHVTSVWSSC